MSAFCGCAPDPKDTQIDTRVLSPDGRLEAIHANDLGGGAATGVVEEVFIVAAGAFPSVNERVLSEECIHDITLTWEGPRSLKVSYHIRADIPEDGQLHQPSLASLFSSAYWTYRHPHDVQVHLVRQVTPAGGGC